MVLIVPLPRKMPKCLMTIASQGFPAVIPGLHAGGSTRQRLRNTGALASEISPVSEHIITCYVCEFPLETTPSKKSTVESYAMSTNKIHGW